MHVHDKILQFIKTTGPTIPSKVAKTIKTDILIASAHLADLASQRKVLISKLKIGGSPLYYLPGQEDKLYAFASGNMNPKNLIVLDKLREEKILQEADLELLEKVALRALKDFAVPLQVRTQEGVNLFWKWHLLSKEETNTLITNKLNPPAPEEVPVAQPEPEVIEEKPEPKVEAPEPKQEVTKQPEPAVETPKQNVEKPESPKEPKQKTLLQKPELEELLDKKPRKKRTIKKEEFLPIIEQFFQTLEIETHDIETIRKNAELNLIISVPSAVGKMKYFCKAKSKKKCDEKDLSAAYMEAQIKKLPLLFLHKNELSAKAVEMLNTDAFENAVTKKIE